jgi:uncharacterized protein YndB with AHSA1/START domain
MTNVTDRIEKDIILRAPRARVWQALSDSRKFAEWFGLTLDGAFTPGASLHGKIRYPEYAHVKWTVVIDRVEPESLFSFRWHPFAVDTKVDYSAEPMTLVEFRLDVVPEGTRLRVVESGFDGVPVARRAQAFEMNEHGWADQLENIRRYVTS